VRDIDNPTARPEKAFGSWNRRSTSSAGGTTDSVAVCVDVPIEPVRTIVPGDAEETTETGATADIAPPGTAVDDVTLATDGSLLTSWMTAPPRGAGLASETESCELPPGIAHEGARLRPAISGDGAGTTVRFAMAVAAPALAVKVTGVSVATGAVVTLNEAVVLVAETETTAGAAATAGFDDVSVTAVPPAHAGAAIVTDPATVRPPTALGTPSVRLVTSTTGSTRRVVQAEKPRSVTVIDTAVATVTEPAVTANVALLAPSGTTTDAGTEASPESELETRTVRPPAGAASLR
jgi:hypothetical protein